MELLLEEVAGSHKVVEEEQQLAAEDSPLGIAHWDEGD